MARTAKKGIRRVSKLADRVAARTVAVQSLLYGDSLKEACARSGLQRRDTLKWFQRYQETKSFEDLKRSGRPRLLTKEDEDLILKVGSWQFSIGSLKGLISSFSCSRRLKHLRIMPEDHFLLVLSCPSEFQGQSLRSPSTAS